MLRTQPTIRPSIRAGPRAKITVAFQKQKPSSCLEHLGKMKFLPVKFPAPVLARIPFLPGSRCSAIPGPAAAVRWMLAAAGLAMLARAAQAEYDGLDISVRSEVVDKPFGKSNPKDRPVHGKVYAIFSVNMIHSQDKLVKPVDATRLAGLVVQELDQHGYVRMLKGQKPDVLISVLYGRGWLRNPYLAGAGPETSGGASSVEGVGQSSVTITGIPSQLFKEKGTGFEARLQKAQYEKLCIRVTAWQYPTDPKAKPKQLWNTTMIVDDPDHRDLNAVAAEMLSAGAHYFDKEIKEEEIDVTAPMGEGKVNVGTPEVVPDPLKPREK